MKRTSIIAAGVVFSVMLLTATTPGQAGAYVLEGPHVLELSAEAMGSIAVLQANQKLLIYPQTPEAAPTVYDETAIYVMPERFRSDIVSDQIQRTHLEFADSAITVIDGRMAVGESPFDLYQQLLRSRTRPRLMRTLNRLGVETAICSLGRIEETVVFVLGARYPDESASQLAIDKETFLPIRLLLVDRGATDAGGRMQIFYRNWQKVQSGWFPYQVDFTINGRLARQIRVTDLRPNPSIPSELMDLEALKASVALHNADTPQGQKQEAVEAVQQAVQDFQKKFE
ncbi:MAG: hypothetical protein KQI81_22320 [Deltaproteobacteria bacterium]|nr:hypothetical protein [Deltaproteobacteria bacterium]